ncbi:TPA: antirestriction protein [Enterobacter hormaechei subsp. steigerwaltii]|uniref:antirestriction protein n=1 Tax=Enterobacter roggenkampii TaxID=1812935 RepID=UPI00174ECE0B|nr:antirestriction protein [Enterobacter roggenkampii]EKY4018163.1 antirestriction protein [Enterobacter roggenkampii]ELJ8295897.1 antirestriction protein [Enterobacter roggenkampii]MBG0695509.1 antirestriction protein [Enterobacter roggenkampii]
MQILTTHVGTTAMSHATALAFGRFSKYAPQVIMNLIEDNLFSVWNTTFNYCELNNHYGYYVPAELALYTVMSPNQQSFVDVNETEFGIIITQLFLVIILRAAKVNDIEVERMMAHFEILHDYAKMVCTSDAYALYESLVSFYKS